MFNNFNSFVVSKMTDKTTLMQFLNKKFSHRRMRNAQLVNETNNHLTEESHLSRVLFRSLTE